MSCALSIHQKECRKSLGCTLYIRCALSIEKYGIWLRFKCLLLELLTLWRRKKWKHFSFQCFQVLEEHFFIWRFPVFFACLWDKVSILKKTLWSTGGIILIGKNWITQARYLSQCHITHYKPQVQPPATKICLHYIPIPRLTDIICFVRTVYMVKHAKGNLCYHCGGIGMYFLTHTIHTHTHNCMCTQHYFSAYLHCLYRPIACCCTKIVSHTDFSLQLPLNSQLLYVFIRLQCMDDKLSWLRGWSSVRCSPHH